jgi:RNA polymerase sigma-70 factor (ECF subfamily)
MAQRSLRPLPLAQASEDSSAWTFTLRGPPTQERDVALAELHSLLLRATRFTLSRRQDQLSELGTAEVDDLAVQAADDALMSILRTLDDFHGASRFTTWASKFAIHEAGVTVRRRSSQAREL